MQKIKDVVVGVMKSLAEKKEGQGVDHPQAWLKKVLTKRELAHIKFNYFKKGVLGLHVDSSSWLYSLNLKKTQLLKDLRSLSGSVKEIRFRLGEVK